MWCVAVVVCLCLGRASSPSATPRFATTTTTNNNNNNNTTTTTNNNNNNNNNNSNKTNTTNTTTMLLIQAATAVSRAPRARPGRAVSACPASCGGLGRCRQDQCPIRCGGTVVAGWLVG
jgi:hypothetical protein